MASSAGPRVPELIRHTILVTGYFGGDEQPEKLSYFERVDAHLRDHGARLLVVNLAPKGLESRCDSLCLPHFIPYAPMFERIHLPDRIRLKAELDEAVQLEAGDLGLTVESAALKLLYFRAFMRRLLRRERPALCVLWHQFNGLHHALANLLNEGGIPYCFAEYGVLPGMIVFDRDGQMAESWVAVESERFRELPVEPARLELVDQYLEMVRVQKRTRRRQPCNDEVLQLIREKRGKAKAVMFFAGEYAYRSGMLPSGFPRARLHSPHFESTAAALSRVAELASKNDWHIIFKPHPLATDSAAAPEAPNEHVSVIRDANVFDCILLSDVTITVLSQVSYLALLQKRPVVLLGRSTLSGKGCAYELESRDDLEGVIKAALRDGFTNGQSQAFRQHAARLCTHYLHAMDRDVEDLLGRGTADAAEFLLAMSRTSVPAAADRNRSLGGTWGTDSDSASLWRVRVPHRVFAASVPIVRLVVRVLPPKLKQALLKTRRWF